MSAAPAAAPGAARAGVLSAVAVCVALAAALRFPGLTAQSLWSDEVYSVEMTRWPLDVILRVQDGHPPLFALLHLLVGQVVDVDVAGRLISAVAGVLAVGLLVVLASEMFDARTGWVAGMLLAVSPLHVWYSQEGRSYALLTMIGVGASLALLRAVRRPSASAWTAFALWSVAGLFTHYVYATLLVAQGVFLLLAGGQTRLLAALAAVAAIGAACLPVLGPEATSFVNAQRGFEWLALPYAAFTYLAGFGLGPSVEELHRQRGVAAIAAHWPAVASVGVIGLAVAVAAPRALARAGRWGGYVLLWAIVPVLLAFGGSWLRDGAFNVRYAIVALPAIVLLIAVTMTDGGTLRVIAWLALLVSLSAKSIAIERIDPVREDVRAAARFLDTHVRPSDRIIVSAHYMDMALRHYYRGAPPIESLPIRPMRSPEAVAGNFRAIQSPGRQVWLVLARDWDDDPDGLFRAALAAHFDLDRAVRARFAGVTIVRFPADGAPAAAGS